MRCGYCDTARAVRHGTRYGKQQNGSVTWFTTDEALAHLASLCRCPGSTGVEAETVGRAVVPEIRRDGQRILRPGVNVGVQLKRAPGTKVSKGHVVECYADGTVKVHLWLGDSHLLAEAAVVPADEWVRARQGSTPVT